MLEKYVLAVPGVEAKEACGTEKICGGLEAGIKGGIHLVRILWQKHAQESDWEFLLIDAHNSSNEEKHTFMLWKVRHECPSGLRFTFNCYRHWAALVIRADDGTGTFFTARRG